MIFSRQKEATGYLISVT